MTAKQKRRLQILEQKLEKDRKSKELVDEMAKNRLSSKTMKLLTSSTKLGQRYTKREKLKRNLQEVSDFK